MAGTRARASVVRTLRIEPTLVLNRSIVYGTLTGAVLLVYAASVVLFRALVGGEMPYAIALLSTGAAAILALPLRDRLQAIVNRLMYGDRDDPYRAISRLGTQLETAAELDEVPAVVVETVAQALRLPYVAIELRNGTGAVIAAAHCEPPAWSRHADLLRLPLVQGGDAIGSLILAPRSPGETFSDADLRLLADLGRQAGPAIQAARLTADLQRSREHLVTTREEERRRLRRELHDGVGPTLAGTLMKTEAARVRLADHPEEAERLLVDLAADTRRTIEEVRRMTYDLRPPALDELGLVGAVHEQAASFTGEPGRPLDVVVEAPANLPPLAAAVEVAAYRIAVEAMTNVARHSGARHGSVRLAAVGGDLVLEVVDDGRGLGDDVHAGIGHRSMRERADELGGSCEVVSVPAGGTRVLARLPLRPANHG